MPEIELELLDQEFAVHRFPPAKEIPAQVFDSSFYWIGKTDDELSIVCDASIELAGGEVSRGWACLRVLGPIDFSETGILAGLSAVLAAAGISIFALSTFDTDYILIPRALREKAVSALDTHGYQIQKSSPEEIGKRESGR